MLPGQVRPASVLGVFQESSLQRDPRHVPLLLYRGHVYTGSSFEAHSLLCFRLFTEEFTTYVKSSRLKVKYKRLRKGMTLSWKHLVRI